MTQAMTLVKSPGNLVWEAVPGYLPQWWSLKQLDEITERIPHLHRRSPTTAAFGLPECLFDGQPWPCRSERWRQLRRNNWGRFASHVQVRLARGLALLAGLAVLCLPLLGAGSPSDSGYTRPWTSRHEIDTKPALVFEDRSPEQTREQAELRNRRAATLRLDWTRGERP